MDGINPMAGDMTNAFNKFFGQLESAANTVQNTQFEIEKQRQRDINKAAKIEAVTAAQRTFENDRSLSNQDMLNAMPSQFRYEGETIETAERRSYSETYSRALGSLTGTRAYYDFANQIAQKKILPENAEAASTAFWTKTFGEGTGNAYHDAAAQKVWTDNIQTWRHNNRKEVHKRANEKLAAVTNKTVFERLSKPDASWAEYFASIDDYTKAMPHLRQGQVASMVMSQWKAAAQRSPAAAARLEAFIHEAPVNDLGVQGQSLLERFPEAMSKHLAELRDGASKYMTMDGQKKVATVAAQLGAIKSMPIVTPADQSAKHKALLNASLLIKKLENTPGTSTSQVAKLRAMVAVENNALNVAVTDANRVVNAGNGNSYPPASGTPKTSAEAVADALAPVNPVPGRSGLTGERLENAHANIINRFDFLNDRNAAEKLGSVLRNAYLGENGFVSKELAAKVNAGLNSSDPQQVTNVISLLSVLDPDRTFYAEKFLKDDPATLVKYEMYSVPGANIQAHHDFFNSENFRSAMGLVDLDRIVSDGEDFKKTELGKRYEEYFFGDHGTGESIAERVLGTDTWFGKHPTLAPEVKRYARQIAKIEVAKSLATGEGEPTLDVLKDRVANYLRKITVPGEKDMLMFRREVPFEYGSTEGGMDDFGVAMGRVRVQYANAVVNPEGVVENTIENVTDAVNEIMGTGILGLTKKDYTTDWDLYTVPARGLNSPARMIYDRKTSMPVVLPINFPFEAQNLYDKGKRYSMWNQFVPFGEALDERDVKFTGDEAKDKLIASRFLHPSIALHPERDMNDNLIGYRVSVMPYFKELSDKYQNREALMELMKTKGPLVSMKKPDKFQLPFLNPNLRQTSLSGMPM
tara:strand:- start:2319 stop:4916 length:2598 start_codon:yes stop_codon:yes gene_type:complete